MVMVLRIMAALVADLGLVTIMILEALIQAGLQCQMVQRDVNSHHGLQHPPLKTPELTVVELLVQARLRHRQEEQIGYLLQQPKHS